MSKQNPTKKNQTTPQATMNKYVLRSDNNESESTSVSQEEVSTKELKSLLVSLTSKVQAFEDKMDVDIKSLHTDMSDFKACLETQGTHIDQLDKTVQDLVAIRLKERIEHLEEQIKYQESRSRKYNLLFYGIAYQADENTTKTIRNFFINDLKINKSTADGILIANAHRVPRRTEILEMPDPIIVKFVLMEDREMVYRARTQLPRTSKKSVRTDLPTELKRKRGALSQIAYRMRTLNKLQTRITEGRGDVRLKFRKNKDEEWEYYENDPETQ